MNMEYNFEGIRPMRDEEISGIIALLTNDDGAKDAYNRTTKGEVPWDEFCNTLKQAQTVDELKEITYKTIVSTIERNTTFSLDLSGTSRLGGDIPTLYITNHRDIVLDATLLNYGLMAKGYRLCQIAIGDNLFVLPWIESTVLALGAFIVRRGLTPRETLRASKNLSGYIHHALKKQETSVWIAQREGRAKNSDDRTQPSVLKMLTLAGEGAFLDRIRSLNIVPSSLSYEYDPCDFLKAREMQAKRDNPQYKKSQSEDLLNMRTGLSGYKGRVHFDIGTPLNEVLFRVDASIPTQEQVVKVAALIDEEIFRRYRLYPGNYAALDLLNENNAHAAMYSSKERQSFIDYVISRVSLIEMEEGIKKDDDFLYRSILAMYANPARNQLSVLSKN